MPRGVSRSIKRVQQNPEHARYTLLGGLAGPQHLGALRVYSVFVLHLANGMP